MTLFIICVEEIDDEKVATGRELKKAYEWPLVPRIGEIVGVGGNFYEVSNVYHYFDRDPSSIQVIVRFPASDFKMLSDDTSWTRVYWEE